MHVSRGVCSFVAACFVLAGSAVAFGAESHPVAGPDVAALRREVRVPVLIPTVVPSGLETTYLVPRVGAYMHGGYDITISGRAGCDAGACTVARLEARSRDARPAGAHATTVPGIGPAWWISNKCGANCGGSFELGFTRKGTEYTLYVTAGTLPQAMTIARGLRQLP
jgi:hypothetical protein